MSYEKYEELVLRRAQDVRLKAAIGDDPYSAGIITPRSKDALVASRIFNVATAAFGILRKSPRKQLLTAPIKLSKTEHEDILLRHTTNVLNIGHVSLRAAQSFTSKPAPNAGICPQSELMFWNALTQQELEPEQTPPRLLVDHEGKVVLADKEYGQPTALSFKSTLVNGTRTPAGTVFSFQPNLDAPSVEVGNFTVMRAQDASIDHIAPLRFSAYAFSSPEIREDVFTPVAHFGTVGQSALTIGAPSYTDLHNRLPEAKLLKEAYNNCTPS